MLGGEVEIRAADVTTVFRIVDSSAVRGTGIEERSDWREAGVQNSEAMSEVGNTWTEEAWEHEESLQASNCGQG